MKSAEATLDTIAKQIREIRPDDPVAKGRQVVLIPGGRRLPLRDSDLPAVVAVPAILVALMLWIACSNVGTMLLARSQARRKEIAIRLSLGASRTRLVRQLLTESMLLAMLGGIAGFAIAVVLMLWSIHSMKDFAPGFMKFDFALDWRSMVFTFILSLISGLAFGLTPALKATRTDLSEALKPGSIWKLAGFRWFGARNLLVLQQVAGSLTLLLITGFVVLGIQRHVTIDPGFDTQNLYVMALDPIRDGYSPDRTEAWFTVLPERIKRIPGVIDATIADYPPVGIHSGSTTVNLKTGSGLDTLHTVETEPVGIEYFETLGIKVLRGRSFAASDSKTDSIVINETMAKQNWPTADPIGREVELNDKRFQVIGVTRNINDGALFAVPKPVAFQLMRPDDYRRPPVEGIVLLIRSTPGTEVLEAIRNDIATTDPDLTVFNANSVREEVNHTLYIARTTMSVYGGMGVFGLILAAVGLAGVTSYAVVQRTKEIGIRVALGASKMDVLRLVSKEGAFLVVAGAIIGQGIAYGITRALSSWFDGLATITKTSTNDPVLLIGAPFALAALTMVACYVPARRSLRIDPSAALREE